MARCPYLEFDGSEYYCDLCKIKHMDLYSSEVKYVCNKEYDEAYKKCDIYKQYSY